MSIGRAVAALREEVRQLREEPEAAIGLPSGIPRLDKKLGGGFKRGTMITVAARTSMGKTALLGELIKNGAEHLLRRGDPRIIGFISAEMPGATILKRLACAELGIPDYGIRVLEEESLDRWEAILDRINQWPIEIYDSRGTDLSEIEANLVGMSGGWEPGDGPSPFAAIFVDHIGKLAVEGTDDIYKTASASANWLYKVAGIYDCPVIVAAQVNRQIEKEITRSKDGEWDVDGTRPLPHDIEGSGKIEQNSDVILLPWRRERYLAMKEGREERRGQMEINVAKNRGGPTGVVTVEWEPSLVRLEYDDQPRIALPEGLKAPTVTRSAAKAALAALKSGADLVEEMA